MTGSSADLTRRHSTGCCGVLPAEGREVHGWVSLCAVKEREEGRWRKDPAAGDSFAGWSAITPAWFCIRKWYYEKILIQNEGIVITGEGKSVLPLRASPLA